MHKITALAAIAGLSAMLAAPAMSQDAALDPSGSFADEWGTTFTFSLCGSGTDLCGTLDVRRRRRTHGKGRWMPGG